MDYLNYDLTIRTDLTTTASSNGIFVTGKFQLNENDKKDIEHAVDELNNENSSIEKEWIENVGTKLANGLFAEPIKSHFDRAKSLDTNKVLRIRLNIESLEVSQYPWEALCRDGRYLATLVQTPVSRFIPGNASTRKNFSSPLKILIIAPNPSSRSLPAIQAEQEIQIIETSLQPYIANGTIILIHDRIGTDRSIREHLRSEQYNIIHFIGHGVSKNGIGYLALVDENSGIEDLANHRRIGQIFQNQRSLGLILLNACKGAEVSTSKAFTGLGPELINIGVPAVVAMRYSITNQTAHLFSKEFYSNLLRMPIDENMQQARWSILVDQYSDPRDFTSPVLFMNRQDAVIFNPLDSKAQELAAKLHPKVGFNKLNTAYEKLQTGTRTMDYKDFWLLVREFSRTYSNDLDHNALNIIRQMNLNVPTLIRAREDDLRLGQIQNSRGEERAMMLNFQDLIDILNEKYGDRRMSSL
jgi:hypothetical protein